MERRTVLKGVAVAGVINLVEAFAFADPEDKGTVVFEAKGDNLRVALVHDSADGYSAIVNTSDKEADACIVSVFYEAEMTLDKDGKAQKLILSETATSPIGAGTNMMIGPFRMRSGAPKVKRVDVELVRSLSKQHFDVK